MSTANMQVLFQAIENHPADSRFKLTDKFQALSCSIGGAETTRRCVCMSWCDYCPGKNAKYGATFSEKVSPSLVQKGPGAVAYEV